MIIINSIITGLFGAYLSHLGFTYKTKEFYIILFWISLIVITSKY